jgi:serine protease Do
MRGARLLPLIGLWAACGGSPRTDVAKRSRPLTPKDIVQRSSPAIVRIEAQGDGGEQFGTGFILDASGVVATNFHVIAGTSEIKIKLHDGSHYPVMQVLNADPMRDLVLVKFAPPKPMPALRLGDSSKVATGDQIVAIGNPLGVFENTVSEGLISSIREVCSSRDVTQHNPQCPGELTLLQISAPISQGSSGGPLFNQVGEVVGITTAIITQGQLINFAMPANYLRPLLLRQQPIALDEFARATRKSSTASAKVPRAPYAKDGFPFSVYDGCKAEQIGEVLKAIQDAIEIGAPLYNRGDIAACFRIYEGTATKIERDAPCKGVRGVFGDVLLKVGAMPDDKAKAWAMRDTFDGLVIAADKMVSAGKLKLP